jgi:AAA+ superfamily predicted ATPase
MDKQRTAQAQETRVPYNGTPPWVQELLDKYSSGVAHAFILHFNAFDYVVPGVSPKSYLAKLMAGRQIVAFYNRSEGITFALPAMREKFMELLGLGEPQDAALAALQSIQGAMPEDLPRSPGAALPLLERLLKLGDPEEKLAAVVVDFAESILPAADIATMSAEDRTNLITVQRWGRDPDIVRSGNPVFLVTENLADLHASIRAASSKFEAIEIPLPDRDARLAFIEYYAGTKPQAFEWKLSKEELANATAGLSLIHIEDIFLRAEQEGKLTWELVRERKEDIIASEFGEVLEIMEPRFGWEMVGGLQHVKDFFTRSVIKPMREGRTSRVPMGVLMTGPSGTGKSVVAEAVAKESGINFVILNLARILGMYVGTSERNLEKALRCIESLSPCGVFIDEVDQSVQRGTAGDSGVSNRIFKRLLEFMSDTGHRGQVIFLAASNRPDLMDAALRRPGRFDKKIPFLVPDEVEREAIFKVMLRKYGLGQVGSIPAFCITATEGWTGAEIEAAVVKAVEVAEDRDVSPHEALAYAVQAISPSTADIEYMSLLAIQEVNDRDLLPPKYRQMLDDRQALQTKLQETRPEAARGRREL